MFFSTVVWAPTLHCQYHHLKCNKIHVNLSSKDSSSIVIVISLTNTCFYTVTLHECLPCFLMCFWSNSQRKNRSKQDPNFISFYKLFFSEAGPGVTYFLGLNNHHEPRLINYLRSLPDNLVQEYMDEVGTSEMHWHTHTHTISRYSIHVGA